MCIKIFPKVSTGVHNSYSVTKVLLQRLKVPIRVHSTSSVKRPGSIIRNKNSSAEADIETDVKQNTTTENEDSITNEVTSSVNRKRKTPKETYSKEVLEFVNSKEYLKSVLCSLPSNLLKRKRATPDALYTVDRDIASKCIYWWGVL
jgi:hypothetical protein